MCTNTANLLQTGASLVTFQNAVATIPHFAKSTRIDKALLLASRELFKERNGAREFVPKILLLITGKVGFEFSGVLPLK